MPMSEVYRDAGAALELGVDVPSALTCTGDKVVLDGRDVALLRISVVDKVAAAAAAAAAHHHHQQQQQQTAGTATGTARATATAPPPPLVSATAAQVNVSVTIASGPGRVIGVGNSDLSTHQRPKGGGILTDGGLARAVVQVTVDCTSADRALVREVDG